MRHTLKVLAPLMCLLVGATLALGADAITVPRDGASSRSVASSTGLGHGTNDQIVSVSGSGGGTLRYLGSKAIPFPSASTLPPTTRLRGTPQASSQ